MTILTQSVTKLNGAFEAVLKHFFLSLHIHITILCRENVTLLKIMPGLNDFIWGQNGEASKSVWQSVGISPLVKIEYKALWMHSTWYVEGQMKNLHLHLTVVYVHFLSGTKWWKWTKWCDFQVSNAAHFEICIRIFLSRLWHDQVSVELIRLLML